MTDHLGITGITVPDPETSQLQASGPILSSASLLVKMLKCTHLSCCFSSGLVHSCQCFDLVLCTSKSLPVTNDHPKPSQEFSEQIRSAIHKMKDLGNICAKKFTRTSPKTWEDEILGMLFWPRLYLWSIKVSQFQDVFGLTTLFRNPGFGIQIGHKETVLFTGLECLQTAG